jgi:hypothetical protein
MNVRRAYEGFIHIGEGCRCLPGSLPLSTWQAYAYFIIALSLCGAESLSCLLLFVLRPAMRPWIFKQPPPPACLPAATAAAAAAGWRIMNMTFYVSKHNNATQCHISFKTSHLFSLCAVPDRRRLRHPPTFLSLLSRAANSWIKIVLRAQQQQQLPVQPVQEHKAKSINFFEI